VVFEVAFLSELEIDDELVCLAVGRDLVDRCLVDGVGIPLTAVRPFVDDACRVILLWRVLNVGFNVSLLTASILPFSSWISLVLGSFRKYQESVWLIYQYQ
jgi:hypothetical protein